MKILIKGIPSNAGALNFGTEQAPKILREAGLISRLSVTNRVIDLGDVVLPEGLIRHSVAPVRNWPAPRIVWEESLKQMDTCFEEGSVTIVIGGGCSIFTGVFNKFYQVYGQDARVISFDHHIDIREPDPELCVGATAYTHWFLTEENKWFSKPYGFSREHIIAVGYDEGTLDENYNVKGIHGYSKAVIESKGVDHVVHRCMTHLDENAKVILHLDLDVISQNDLKSVYMPSPNGMKMETVQRLLQGIVRDKRVVGLVVTEFSGAYDMRESDAEKVADLISGLFY